MGVVALAGRCRSVGAVWTHGVIHGGCWWYGKRARVDTGLGGHDPTSANRSGVVAIKDVAYARSFFYDYGFCISRCFCFGDYLVIILWNSFVVRRRRSKVEGAVHWAVQWIVVRIMIGFGLIAAVVRERSVKRVRPGRRRRSYGRKGGHCFLAYFFRTNWIHTDRMRFSRRSN